MQLMKIVSSVSLILLLSGCSLSKLNVNQPTKPKIDSTIEVIDRTSIKTIKDVNAIAFEWNKVNDKRVTGYNFYRGNISNNSTKLKHIKTVDNRHTTHFVDEDVKPNTKYVYKISSATKGETESRTTAAYYVSTLSTLQPISLVQAITNLPKQIKIVWRPHPSSKVEKYIIERFDKKNKKWNSIASVKSRLQVEYIDDNLKDGEEYSYRVTAVTFDGVKATASKVVNAKTKPKPLSIRNLKASSNKAKQITLTWDKSNTIDVTKYIVYRSSFEKFGFIKEKKLDSTSLDYTDNVNANGKSYYYKVSAVDVDELESLESKVIKGTSLVNPKKPKFASAEIIGNKALIKWQAGDNRAKTYNVYKTIKEGFFNSKTVKYTNIDSLNFTDDDISSGLNYTYSVQAVDKNGLVSDKTESISFIK